MGQQVQLFAVMGQPIAHSLSPVMHNQAFRQRDWPAFYFPVEAGPDQLTQKLAAFQSLGGVGANLTRPLKEVIVPLLREASPWVQRTGACNTIAWRDGGWVGDNTDVQALLEALPPARPGTRLGVGGRRGSPSQWRCPNRAGVSCHGGFASSPFTSLGHLDYRLG